MRPGYIQHIAFCLAALLFAAVRLDAQTVTLLEMTNTVWRYYQSSNQPPNIGNLVWQAADYDDGAWPIGPGVFGVEPDPVLPADAQIRTPLNLTNSPATMATVTYYFRTQFDYVDAMSGVDLTFSMLIDDGAVVYLNAIELFRVRMPAGTPTFSTLTQASSVEGLIEYTNIINSAALRQGTNVIAVELHQSSAFSSDVVFGMSLSATRQIPITITKQPKGGVVGIGDPLSLSVEVTGSSPRFQWFRNGAAISGETSSNYVINVAATANSGTYFVRVVNGISTNDSQSVVIQMVPDTFSPVPLSAIVEEHETNTVILAFDDAILRIRSMDPIHSATNAANYAVKIVGDQRALIVRAAQVAGNQIRLVLEQNWDRSKEYYITINNITDTSTNVIKPNTQIGIQFRASTNVFQVGHLWKWTMLFASNLPPEWVCTNYFEDPFIWAEGRGPFYFEPDALNTSCMGPISNGSGNGTELSIGYSSYYFRTHFVLPPGLTSSETILRFAYIVDDGAIFYLNCQEIFRTNMPAGPVRFDTRAPAAFEANVCRTNNVPGTYLLPGVNTLAVEVHQNQSPFSDSDAAFGLVLDALYTQGLRIPEIQYRKVPPESLVLNWPDSAWSLEENTSARTNGWTAVPTVGNAYTNTVPNRYFRLRKE